MMLDMMMTIANIPTSGLFMEIMRKNIPPNINKIYHGEMMKKHRLTTIPKKTQNRNWKIFEDPSEKLNTADETFFNSMIK